MPLQNRVDPFGQIHATAARGMFTGNRGVIHDPGTRTLLRRRWSTRAWIICVCDFRGRRRDVMGRNARSGNAGWTELFFLDEPTALAAGHRPCFYCQHAKAKAYAEAFGRAFGVAQPRAAEIDARLHGERIASGGRALPFDIADLDILPEGAFVANGRAAFAKRNGALLRWSLEGYRAPETAGAAGAGWTILTPATTLAVLRAGYRPAWHGSADAAASDPARGAMV